MTLVARGLGETQTITSLAERGSETQSEESPSWTKESMTEWNPPTMLAAVSNKLETSARD
jgi:hypothetical protein